MITIGQANERRRKRKEAQEDLGRVLKDRRSIMVIHYSCESFYDRPEGASPRITSLAIRSFATGQTTSFSIHQMAERKSISHDQISSRYDELEKEMLTEFNEFLAQHKDKWWIHWNMRDMNYGFPAIAHRCRVLGLQPTELSDDRLLDLARTMYRLFGATYASHPRLKSIVEMNKISNKDMLDGQQEADAFDRGEYVKLHQSTLRKVDILASLLERVEDGQLKTASTPREQYGSRIAVVAAFFQEHPLAIVGLSAIGIIGFIITLIGWIIS